MMMLPSFFVLFLCLGFSVCTLTSEEDFDYDSSDYILDQDDFVFTELKFNGVCPYPPYPHNIYPLFRVLFLYVAKSEERIVQLFISLIPKIGDISLLNDIQAAVVWKFVKGDFYPFTPDSFNPKVRVQEYNGPVPYIEWDMNEDSEDQIEVNFENSTEENEFDHRTGIYDDACEKDCDKPQLQAGSIRGIPGEDFPDYYDIPITSFNCAGKHIPGFYADLETGCQVFHICWPHRRESFLCPVGTIFNQAISTCDYWYSSNCSLAPLYFHSSPSSSNEEELLGKEESLADLLVKFQKETPWTPEDHSMKSKGPKSFATFLESSTLSPLVYKSQATLTRVPQQTKSNSDESKHIPTTDKTRSNTVWAPKLKFLPIKSKITIYLDSSKSMDQETVQVPSTKLVPAFKLPREPLISKKDKSVSEVLQEILKVTESMTKEARKFITRLGIDRLKNQPLKSLKVKTTLGEETDKPHGFLTVKTTNKFSKASPKSTPNKSLNVELKHLPEINPKFIVKPFAKEKLTPEKRIKLSIVIPSTPLKPSESLFTLK